MICISPYRAAPTRCGIAWCVVMALQSYLALANEHEVCVLIQPSPPI